MHSGSDQCRVVHHLHASLLVRDRRREDIAIEHRTVYHRVAVREPLAAERKVLHVCIVRARSQRGVVVCCVVVVHGEREDVLVHAVDELRELAVIHHRIETLHSRRQ